MPRPSLRDHPRIRGEHTHAAAIEASRPGSSPHTRGALHQIRHRAIERGIIPAYAGSTGSRVAARPWARDHPRIRGEHHKPAAANPFGDGSSPHTRGALPPRSQLISPAGIIPAYAGSTDIHRAGNPSGPDHPRIRGEHGVETIVGLRVGGSSPHTRGALMMNDHEVWVDRIIPAYAGSTKHSSNPAWISSGSSPHTRGAQGPGRKDDAMSGIIPAYAGSTVSVFA